MTMNVDKLLDGSYKWLRDNTSWKRSKRLIDWGEIIEIFTPYLDRHNDYIQLYLKKDGDDYILTDDSDTLDDLEMCGSSLDSSDMKTTLKGFGVRQDKNELFIKTSEEGFPQAMHSLMQAILAINGLRE